MKNTDLVMLKEIQIYILMRNADLVFVKKIHICILMKSTDLEKKFRYVI